MQSKFHSYSDVELNHGSHEGIVQKQTAYKERTVSSRLASTQSVLDDDGDCETVRMEDVKFGESVSEIM